MGQKWIPTKQKGVRYYEHPTRKHLNKPDRYYSLRFRVDGVCREQGVGWASDGWNEGKCADLRKELAANVRTATGPSSLKAKRVARKNVEDAKMKEAESKKNLTFRNFYLTSYFPYVSNERTDATNKREESLVDVWINPVIGNKSILDVSVADLDTLKRRMYDSGRAARTVEYALAVVRQVYNRAIALGVYPYANPVKLVKLPSYDNAKMRFLTVAEADLLLDRLNCAKSLNTLNAHDMALLSLRTGMRAGEILSLEKAHVNLQAGHLFIPKTTVNKVGRIVFLPRDALEMLQRRVQVFDVFLFPKDDGKSKIKEVPTRFYDTVASSGLNDGITDQKLKVTFHTLRHTFASWMVQSGVSLYELQKMLGHKTPAMTQRYSHLSGNQLKDIANNYHTLIQKLS